MAASTAWAGMPMSPFDSLGETIRLNGIAKLRLEALSFFAVLLLLLGAIVQRIWNGLRGDFPRLPELSYRRAMGLIFLWGLLISVVLSMISGARELMTPGAWERAGATYRLSAERRASDAAFQARELNLRRLGRALAAYADSHDGRFPAHELVSDIPDDLWLTLSVTGDRYVYVAGRQSPAKGKAGEVLAYEPEVYGAERLVLFSDGRIDRLRYSELTARYRNELPDSLRDYDYAQ
jgi:hypothetical protein